MIVQQSLNFIYFYLISLIAYLIRFYSFINRMLVKICEGQVHGFAIRGDEKDEVIKKAKDDAAATSYQFIAEVFGI